MPRPLPPRLLRYRRQAARAREPSTIVTVLSACLAIQCEPVACRARRRPQIQGLLGQAEAWMRMRSAFSRVRPRTASGTRIGRSVAPARGGTVGERAPPDVGWPRAERFVESSGRFQPGATAFAARNGRHQHPRAGSRSPPRRLSFRRSVQSLSVRGPDGQTPPRTRRRSILLAGKMLKQETFVADRLPERMLPGDLPSPPISWRYLARMSEDFCMDAECPLARWMEARSGPSERMGIAVVGDIADGGSSARCFSRVRLGARRRLARGKQENRHRLAARHGRSMHRQEAPGS